MSHLEREIAHQNRLKFENLLLHREEEEDEEEFGSRRGSDGSDQTTTTDEDDSTSSSPVSSSPWSNTSPYSKSPWSNLTQTRTQSVGSLLREDGHVYSIAVRDGTLYTGSHSKNIRVWKNLHDSGGFKSASGFVKAIITTHARVFTAHHDGKIRVWTRDGKRVGTLPKLTDQLKSSINPNSYVEIRRGHRVLKNKHYDAVSCLALNEPAGLLYSGSWDKTVKVWRLRDFKCMESITAHHDAINTVVVGFNGLLFTGSADGSLKVWRRRESGRHCHVRTLLRGENAVTSLAVAGESVLYSGSSDGLVSFWVKEEEEMVYGGVLRGHKVGVLCLGVAGCMVMSGSADKTICVWKREGLGEGYFGQHSCVAVLTGHCGPVKCIAIEKDCYEDEDADEEQQRWIVYSGSLDKSVRIWRVLEHASEHDSSE